MRQSTYQTLPLEALHELLVDGAKKLLIAYDLKEAGLKEFTAYKKYVECLIEIIEKKKKETLEMSSR